MAALTEEQKLERSKKMKEVWAARKAAQEETVNNMDYETLYKAALAHSKEIENRLATAEAKNTELEKICKAYVEQANNTNRAIQKVTMEYNARTQYMLDCVKHAYLSIQFAVNASHNEGDTEGRTQQGEQ